MATQKSAQRVSLPGLLTLPSGARPAEVFYGRMLIDGEWREAHSGLRLERSSPAHQCLVASYPAAGEADLNDAAMAAKRAFSEGAWPQWSNQQRAACLLKVADAIEAAADRLAMQETLESGKPLLQARGEMLACADLWRYAAALARTLNGESYNHLGPQLLALVLRQPIGVVGMITPWNFPLLIVCQKLPFALAAGCTVVLKPSELTSGTALMLGQILLQQGLPAGVVNIVTGDGPVLGQALVRHEEIAMVSFTGSTRVGRQIAQQCGAQLKKVALELGGKNPQIIFPDCDWEAAVDAVLQGVFFNAGECCNSGSRILVHESILEQFTAALLAKIDRISVGDPLHPQTRVGALISQQHMQGIVQKIEQARIQGAAVLLGGQIYPDQQGFFLQPTIVSNLTPDMAIAREELFGPVLAILSFRDIGHAISLANDSMYGLSAAVWSRDIDTCLMAARGIEAGTVWLNTFLEGYPELPFGGFKESGSGRELGSSAVHEYTETKTVQLHIGERSGWWIERSAAQAERHHQVTAAAGAPSSADKG